MLNAMRVGAGSKIVKFIIFSFLLLAVAGMALMDVGGFFRSGGTQNNVVATVAGQKISAVEFDRTVRRAINQQGLMDINMAYKLGLVNQYLGQQVSTILMQKAAHDQGIVVDNKVIAERIAALVAPYAKDGMSTADAFKRILMSQNLTEGEFIAMMRGELTNLTMRGSLQSAATVVSDAEVNALYQQQHEERTIKALVFSNADAKGAEKPTDEVLKPFYQSGQEKYAVPETRVFTVAVLTDEAARKTIDVSDEELQALYDERIDEYTEKEKRILQQALFTSEGEAKEAYEQVKAGKALKEAAGKSYIGEEAFEEAGLSKEIADAAFALNKGEVAEPVQTSLGWHVLVMKDTVASKVKPFDSVKEAIKKELVEEKAANQIVETSNQIDDALASGEALDKLAKDFHLEVKKVGPVRQDGSTPDNKEGLAAFAKSRQDILETAFSLEAGETSSVQELPDGTYAVVQMETVTPKTYKDFDSAKADLAKLWIADQQDIITRRQATEALQAAKAGKSLEEIAKETGATIKTVTIDNGKAAEAPLTEPLKKLLFENSKGTYQLTPAKDSYVLATVTAVKMPDPSKASKEDLEAIRKTAQQNAQNEIFAVFFKELENKYGAKINQDALARLYETNSEQQF